MHIKVCTMQCNTFTYINVCVQRSYIDVHYGLLCVFCHVIFLISHHLLLYLIQVLSLRTLHEQLLRLLSSEEQQELQLVSAFAPFAGLNPLHHNLYTQPLWTAAVAQYTRGMEPAEQRIAGKLRQKLSKLDAHPQQVKYMYFCL